MGGLMHNTVHTKRVIALTAAVAAALSLSLAVGSAAAAPLKNAERFCTEKAGGSFTGDDSQYMCAGNAPAKTFPFLKGAMGQCAHSFKGSFSVQEANETTGDFRYTCTLQ